jgi:hypothetical protein
MKKIEQNIFVLNLAIPGWLCQMLLAHDVLQAVLVTHKALGD